MPLSCPTGEAETAMYIPTSSAIGRGHTQQYEVPSTSSLKVVDSEAYSWKPWVCIGMVGTKERWPGC